MPLDGKDIEKINELIKKSLTGEDFTKGVGEAVKTVVGGLKLEEIISTKVKDAVKATQPSGNNDKGKDGDKDDSGAAKRIASLEKMVQQEQEARRHAEEKARLDRLYSETRSALVKAGIPEARVHLALAAIKESGVLTVADDGELGWKGQDKYGVETTLSLAEGAAAWAKTDDGKAFLPPRNVQGTGDGVGGVGEGGKEMPLPKNKAGKTDFSALGARLDFSTLDLKL